MYMQTCTECESWDKKLSAATNVLANQFNNYGIGTKMIDLIKYVQHMFQLIFTCGKSYPHLTICEMSCTHVTPQIHDNNIRSWG